MRLDDEEKKALEHAIEDIDDEVYLFGSRLDDHAKGGDIDILILSGGSSYKVSQKVSVEFFMKCEEKIDVIVMNPNRLTEAQKAFLNGINKVKIK